MAKKSKLKVKLISWTKGVESTVVAGIRQCYSSVGASELKKKTDEVTQKRLIKLVMESGHTSTIEHANFTFAIEGISRACSHQLVRHRIASFSQQSQRYVDLSKKGMVYVVPKSIEKDKKLTKNYKKMMVRAEADYKKLLEAGVAPEDARFVLPNACETKMVVTMNARSLLNFFKLRCCDRAQWEIRALAFEMLALVKKKAPLLFASAGPTCVTEKICWEGDKNCGRWKKIKGAELRRRRNG